MAKLRAITDRRGALIAVKTAHTAVWGVVAGSIVALPVMGYWRRFDWAAGLAAIVLLECAVLAVNGCRCPLTHIAEGLSEERNENMDIYLPRWLARWNKEIFGTLLGINGIWTLWLWLRR